MGVFSILLRFSETCIPRICSSVGIPQCRVLFLAVCTSVGLCPQTMWCGEFHNAEGNLWVLFVLRGVFLAFCSSVGLGPQILWCIPHCRGLPLVFICFARCIPCGLEFCCTWSSDLVVYSTLQRVTSGFYLFCEVYSLRFGVLLHLVLRSCGVFHIAEGYLWVLFVLRGVFLVVCSSVGLGPQILWCIPHCRGLPLVFICFARCIPCDLEFCCTWSSDHAVFSTLQRVASGFYFFCEVYFLRFGVLLDFCSQTIRWAFNKEAFSVNFIADRFSLPNLLILLLGPCLAHSGAP